MDVQCVRRETSARGQGPLGLPRAPCRTVGPATMTRLVGLLPGEAPREALVIAGSEQVAVRK